MALSLRWGRVRGRQTGVGVGVGIGELQGRRDSTCQAQPGLSGSPHVVSLAHRAQLCLYFTESTDTTVIQFPSCQSVGERAGSGVGVGDGNGPFSTLFLSPRPPASQQLVWLSDQWKAAPACGQDLQKGRKHPALPALSSKLRLSFGVFRRTRRQDSGRNTFKDANGS